MTVQLYVGNLAYDVTENEIRELFTAGVQPSRVRLPTDRETGKPRGFAFVEFGDRAGAEEAIRRLDKTVFKGRPLAVNEARPREAGPAAARPGSASPGGYAPLDASDAPPRLPVDRRNFGPDALPRNKRRQEVRGTKKEGRPTAVAPRQAARWDAPGRADPDEAQEDLLLDDFASWARDDSEQEKE